jgi:hypothetical protein
MTTEKATQRLQMLLELYSRGTLTTNLVEIEIYEIAVYIEPLQLVTMLPDSLHHEMATMTSYPLLRREDWFTTGSSCGFTRYTDADRQKWREREDKKYEGFCRLYRYFIEHESA